MKLILVHAVLFFSAQLRFAGDEEVCLADPALYKHDGVYYLSMEQSHPRRLAFWIYASKELKDWYVPNTEYGDGYILKAGEQAFGTEEFWA